MLDLKTVWNLLGFIFIFPIYLSGCASIGPTKPNKPYSGNSHPAVLNELAQTNPLLVQELGKLPEIQDGISETETSALKDIGKLYKSDSETFDNAFNVMYKIGLPEYRKYCSPLQAVFWLAEDGKLDSTKDILKDYSLKKLLKAAWIFDPLSSRILSDQQIKEIINGIEEEPIKESYLDNLKNGSTHYQIQHNLAADYRRSKRMKSKVFSKDAAKVIKEYLIKVERAPRWKSFDIVIDRLNSPELVDYYERHVISYKYVRGYGEGPEEASRVFINKYGHCAQITAFTVYVLKKAGYEARRYIVADPAGMSPKGNYHRACLFIVGGEKYIMDNGRRDPRGIVRYEDYESLESRKKSEKLQWEPMLYTR